MQILIIGDDRNAQEVKLKFGYQHQYFNEPDRAVAEKYFNAVDTIFDFTLHHTPQAIDLYSGKDTVVFVNTTRCALVQFKAVATNPVTVPLMGFNGLPGFITNPVLEVSLSTDSHRSALHNICAQLATDFREVDDRVGLVTPRVICMIINEAYVTVQEGTASRADIDEAMKLGTNYPKGPFEWAQSIGLDHVYHTLEALYQDTHDERYKIAPLLKREYLNQIQ